MKKNCKIEICYGYEVQIIINIVKEDPEGLYEDL